MASSPQQLPAASSLAATLHRGFGVLATIIVLSALVYGFGGDLPAAPHQQQAPPLLSSGGDEHAASLSHPPRLFLSLRTYSGGKAAFNERFGPMLEAFVDWKGTRVVVILDDESPADHTWGGELERRFAHVKSSFFVLYAAPLPNGTLDFRPFRAHGARYGGEGYTRMLYDTYFLDHYLPPEASPSDLVGIIDMDAPLGALVTPEVVWRRESPHIRLPAMHTDIYPGDALLLGEGTPYEFMQTDAMPQWLYVDTFAAARAHLAAKAGVADFRSAWLRLAGLQKAGADVISSPFNVLAHYAVHYEPLRYAAVTRDDPAIAVLTSNNMNNARIRAGCCRSFAASPVPPVLSNCSVAEVHDAEHITYLDKSKWPAVERARAADRAYATIHRVLEGQPREEQARRHAACASLFPGLVGGGGGGPG